MQYSSFLSSVKALLRWVFFSWNFKLIEIFEVVSEWMFFEDHQYSDRSDSETWLSHDSKSFVCLITGLSKCDLLICVWNGILLIILRLNVFFILGSIGFNRFYGVLLLLLVQMKHYKHTVIHHCMVHFTCGYKYDVSQPCLSLINFILAIPPPLYIY